MILSTFSVYASAPRPNELSVAEALPMMESLPDLPRPDPLSCVERVAIPDIDQAIDTSWSPDGTRLAFVRIVTSPSRKTITGYEEDPDLAVLNVARGTVDHLGEGMRPRWSGTGTFLSFWRSGRLYVVRAGSIVTVLDSTVPDTRWVGDELIYFLRDEVRGWTESGGERILSRTDWEHMPRYPKDDTYFSADGGLFIVTRYRMDGSAYRYIGETATGQVAPLETPGTTYTEWAPSGQTLLVRSAGEVELRGAHGVRSAAPVSAFPGPVHGWTPDGKGLLMGAVTPTMPAGATFDTFLVWEGGRVTATATLPNLLGGRSFSPDGRYFAGVARVGLYETQLELYRCGTRRPAGPQRADPVARARQDRVDGDGRRFVRPVAGYVSQFLQGRHTGIDIAAPFGSIVTAADDGVVTLVGWVPVGGRAVCVQHAGGLESCYYHTSLAYVSAGQRVARGQPVAAIGMSGATTGPHVHWEVKQDGRIVDPLKR